MTDTELPFGPTVTSAAADRDLALERVDAAADDDWKDRAWVTLFGYLRNHEEFFVDDFWSDTELDQPREARALGPLVLRASRAGYMVKTGRSRPSVRSHLSDKPIWRSTIWRGITR